VDVYTLPEQKLLGLILILLFSHRLARFKAHRVSYITPSEPHTGLPFLLEQSILQSELRKARNKTWNNERR